MKPPLWINDLSSLFWKEAPALEPFPRLLRDVIPQLSFDLTIEELPGLGSEKVRRFLSRIGWTWHDPVPDRPLRACIVAENGGGWIFLDAEDELAERTYSLAHELAHFLRHYWHPRQRAIAALGPVILEVLDGHRLATPQERLHALLRHAPLAGYSHLMRRSMGLYNPDLALAEEEADQLAFELLAPAEEVRRLAGSGSCEEGFEVILRETFGLPASAAKAYARVLCPVSDSSPVVERLKKAHQTRRTLDPGREPSPGGSRDERHT